jgi:hexosaminidase
MVRFAWALGATATADASCLAPNPGACGTGAGPFWLNRGTSHAPHSTMAYLGRTAGGDYTVTFDASDGALSRFGAPLASCAAAADGGRGVAGGEAFVAHLSLGAATPTSFIEVTATFSPGAAADALPTVTAATVTPSATLPAATRWCADQARKTEDAGAISSVSSMPLSSACSPTGGRRVQFVVPASLVKENTAAPGANEGYLRAQFGHTSTDAAGLAQYAAAFPTLASDNAHPGCYGVPKNFQIFCWGAEGSANIDPTNAGLCVAPDASGTLVEDFTLAEGCPAEAAATPANSYIPQHLFPQPKSWQNGTELASFADKFAVDVTGAGNAVTQKLVTTAVDRFVTAVGLTTAGNIKLVVKVGSDSIVSSLATNESYTLTVAADGAVAIDAPTVFGAYHALTTLAQLTETRTAGTVVPNAPWTIADEPRYRHRGILVDTARQYLQVATLERIVDAMALAKMNVFHWHLTDATSFPVELSGASSSKLSTNGSYDASQVYTKANVTAVVAYALARGVRVQPEVDTPGHSYSWGEAFPEALECNTPTDQYWPMCPEPPCGYLNVTSQIAQDLGREVWEDVIEMFNTSEYVHLGGDEQSKTCWKDETEAKFKGWFKHLLNTTGARGKGTINWAGSVLSIGTNLTNLTVPSIIAGGKPPMLQTWSEDANKMKALALGYDIIDSSASSWYLDCGQGNWLGANVGGNWVGKSWCTPFKTWQTVYNYDPEDGVAEEYWGKIKGGEVALWGEQNGDTNYESKLWPRAAAAAERLWSPKGTRDPGCAQSRLRYYRASLEAGGKGSGSGSRDKMKPAPMEPEYCRHNPAMCNAYLFVSGLPLPTCDGVPSVTPSAEDKVAAGYKPATIALGAGFGLASAALALGFAKGRRATAESTTALLPEGSSSAGDARPPSINGGHSRAASDMEVGSNPGVGEQ